MEPRTGDFDPFDVATLILDAVAILHARGHQRLRVFPGLGGTNSWRIAVTTDDNIITEDDYVTLRDWDRVFKYAAAADAYVAGLIVTPATRPEQIASLILCDLPDQGVGDDAAYVAWYAELLRQVHLHHGLPIAYGFVPSLSHANWAIGWEGQSHIPAPPAPRITVPAILFKLTRLWTPSMSSDDLYNATRQWWTLGERKMNAQYAFAVCGGMIKGVYAIDPTSWTQNEDSRWCFTGERACGLEMKYLNTSARHLYKPGQANPVLYLNC